MAQIVPTKANLMNTKKSLELAKLGYDLMDRKRNILVREMMQLIDQAKAVQTYVYDTAGHFEFADVEPEEQTADVRSFGFLETNADFDEACRRFQEVKTLTVSLSEIETSICRLADAVKKTQKRSNALSNIMIPRFESTVKLISEALDEKEREDFSRLKVVKRQKK